MSKGLVELVLAGCLLMAGCAPGGTIKARLEGDRSLDMRTGQTLELEVDSNPTTGYSWAVASSRNSGVLRQKRKDKYVPPSTDLVGAGGKQIFYFEALKRGRAVLSFEYRRPWEKDKGPAEKYTVIVDVH